MGLFSLAETRDYLIELGKALFPGLAWGSKKSSPSRRANYLAGAIAQLDQHTDTAIIELHPRTAPDGKPINDWGATVGLPRKTATPARGSLAGRVRGTAATPVVAGTELQDDATGMIFEIASDDVIGIGGSVDVDIVGVDTGDPTTSGVGARSRLSAGTALKFLSTPPGLQTIVTLVKDLDQDGADNEAYGSYAPRVQATFNTSQRSGGSALDFQQWALASLPQAAAAFTYRFRAGRNSIDIAIFTAAAGSARALTDDERAAALLYIQTQTNAPFHVSGDGGPLRILKTVPDPQRVEIRLTAENLPPFRFDWDDSVVPTVASWNAGTNELQFSGGALPSSLRAGHGIVLDGVVGGSGANSQDGTPITIKAISAVDKVILASAPSTPPASPDKIYSSGPLVAPVRDAILEHLNGGVVYAGRGRTLIPASKAAPGVPGGPSIVGADILVDGVGAANPGGKYGAWAGGILLDNLRSIARYQLGVRSLTVVTPATDYEALDDALPADDSQIHYVTPLTVIVRRA